MVACEEQVIVRRFSQVLTKPIGILHSFAWGPETCRHDDELPLDLINRSIDCLCHINFYAAVLMISLFCSHCSIAATIQEQVGDMAAIEMEIRVSTICIACHVQYGCRVDATGRRLMHGFPIDSSCSSRLCVSIVLEAATAVSLRAGPCKGPKPLKHVFITSM